MERRIVLRPLLSNSWAGVTKYKNCYTDICPFMTRSGRIYTGLEEYEKERKELEKALHTELHNSSEFWANFFIRVHDEDITLDIDEPSDKLKYFFLKGHPEVKSGLSDNKAGARFVLIDEEGEAVLHVKKAEIKQMAYEELGKMSYIDMRDCLRLYGVRSDDVSDVLAKSKLCDLVEQGPEKFKIIWIDNKDRKIQSIIEKAVAKNVIRKSGNRYIYGTEELGYGIEDAIAYMNNPQNVDTKTAIIKLVEAKHK